GEGPGGARPDPRRGGDRRPGREVERAGGVALEPNVELSHVTMAFGSRPVFRDLSCRFPKARVSCILGGSGSGKSTMLKLIGGLVRPQSGRVVVDGDDVTSLSERHLFRVRRKLGMMFQGGALLDSMTVFDNLALPLRERGEPEDH